MPSKKAFHDYDAFVEKFKPKHTTDDCYTPPAVYDAVKQWVTDRWHISPDTPIVRPFWPGGDYEHYDYPPGVRGHRQPPVQHIGKD